MSQEMKDKPMLKVVWAETLWRPPVQDTNSFRIRIQAKPSYCVHPQSAQVCMFNHFQIFRAQLWLRGSEPEGQIECTCSSEAELSLYVVVT